MNIDELLTQERRARMAAERLLAQKEAELFEANRKLSRHARALSEDLVETRGEVEEVKGENTRVRADLERATTEVTIAKRRLWSSIETIEDGFAVFDQEHRLVVANPAYYQPFDGLECIRPGVHYEEVVEAALSEGIVNIGEMRPAEWREKMLARWYGPAPDPRQITLWDGTHVRLVDRRAPGGDTVCLGLNVTDAIRREDKLKEAMEQAKAASRAKSAFLANMSHEIRTPMNGVVSMAELMAEEDLNEEMAEYVETIRNSGEALLTIINDVLDYSKMEASKMVLHPEPFDLERTIMEIILLQQPALREKDVKVVVDYDMFLPTLFEGDHVRVRQVLTNLIGNAVKFTEQGQVMVRVVGLPLDPGPSQRLHITVEDTGIGIAPEMQPHIFGEFNQVEDERNRKFDGTGLGLAITKQLVELMGGQIWVESAIGEGSCFGLHLTLPVVETLEETDLPLWMRRAVLVMPDDLHRDILAKRLVAMGLAVRAVASKAEGITAARSAQLVLVDCSLPDMRCDVFAEGLKDAGARAAIIAIGHMEGLSEAPAWAAGTLNKPLTRPDLIAALSALEEPAAVEADGDTGAPAELQMDQEEPQTEALAEAPEADVIDAPLESFTAPESDAPAPMFGSRRRPQAEPSTPPSVEDIEVVDAPDTAFEITVESRTPEAPIPAQVPIEQVAADVEAEMTPGPNLAAADFLEDEDVGNIFAPTKPDAPLRQMRVLAAEDNKTNRLVFSKLIKAADIDLTFAENGFEAVEAFERINPDLIFMDISMPGMDGKEATRAIRQIEADKGLPATRIVALTAHAMTGDSEEIMGHGLDEHLTKPLKKPLILAEIQGACPPEARAPLPEEDAGKESA